MTGTPTAADRRRGGRGRGRGRGAGGAAALRPRGAWSRRRAGRRAPQPSREKARSAGSSCSSRPRARRRRPPRGPRRRRRKRAASGRGAGGWAPVPAPGPSGPWPGAVAAGSVREWSELVVRVGGRPGPPGRGAPRSPSRPGRADSAYPEASRQPARPSLGSSTSNPARVGAIPNRGPPAWGAGPWGRPGTSAPERRTVKLQSSRGGSNAIRPHAHVPSPAGRDEASHGWRRGGPGPRRCRRRGRGTAQPLLRRLSAGSRRVLGWDRARPGGRARAAGAVPGRRAPAAVVTGGAGAGPGLRRRGPGIRG